MSDLIKRSDAIKVLKDSVVEMGGDDFCEMGVHIDDIEAVVNAIPSADRPSGEWMPCSERLPSEQGQYLVTFLLCNGDPWVYVLSFCKGKFYETDDEWGDVEYDDVAAWMPLPEPWKGADNDN